MDKWHDLVIGGLLVTPFAGYAAAAFLGSLLARALLRRTSLGRIVLQVPLVEFALCVCALALLLLSA